MRKALVALCALVLVGTLVASAAAYDRKPVRLSGLTPDEWGNTVSNVEAWVRSSRYPRGKNIWCTGVIMSNYPEKKSWFWRGSGSTQVRYWDKLACAVVLPDVGKKAIFVADPMSGGIQVKRLSYVRTAPAPAPPPPPPPPPPPAAPAPSKCDPNYSGACVPDVPYDLDCADINGPVYVVGYDPHGFDGDGDGVGCEY